MKAKKLKELLSKVKDEADIVVSCDEELNVLYDGFEVCELTDLKKVCIFPLSGTEINI